ncbi:hypothetical protein [Vallitalea okinawensis]|uniref:hypothetical protein n=1 Tax=Vallitalea okinawensis TaxID=2078660 RepID=UPI000CFCF93A|nr:hypothetical protein [Vallitalea okinawensis]
MNIEEEKFLSVLKKVKSDKLICHRVNKEDTSEKFRKIKKVAYYDLDKYNSKKQIVNRKLYKKIEQTFINKFKKEISDLGISETVFKNPTINMDAIQINETTVDGKKVINITALADIEEIVNVEGVDYYYNMTVPFSITKIGLEDSTDCPSDE